MLDEMAIKKIENKLNDMSETYYDSRNLEVKERSRGYCQGIAFALYEVGYVVEWCGGKATIVKDD